MPVRMVVTFVGQGTRRSRPRSLRSPDSRLPREVLRAHTSGQAATPSPTAQPFGSAAFNYAAPRVTDALAPAP
jgi:hypothetical protein